MPIGKSLVPKTCRTWRRRRGDPNYQGFFENLAAVVVDGGGPAALRSKLNLWTLPPT
jgi:hypothetical protein